MPRAPCVSTLSRPKAAGTCGSYKPRSHEFQHSAARRRLLSNKFVSSTARSFQHSAARRRLRAVRVRTWRIQTVSTLSRPKAAGTTIPFMLRTATFQHSAARRRLLAHIASRYEWQDVSTLSRPKAAVTLPSYHIPTKVVSTLSRPMAAGFRIQSIEVRLGFNTQPPEGGWRIYKCPFISFSVSTLSRPKAAASSHG